MRKRKRKCTEKPTADNDDVVLERRVMLVIVFLPAILMVLLFGGLIYIALPILIVAWLVSLFSHA